MKCYFGSGEGIYKRVVEMKKIYAKDFFNITIFKTVMAILLFQVFDIIGYRSIKCYGCLHGDIGCRPYCEPLFGWMSWLYYYLFLVVIAYFIACLISLFRKVK